MMNPVNSNSPNQFSLIILSSLTQEQCEEFTSTDSKTGQAAYLSLTENSYLGLDFFMKEGVQVAFNNLKAKYFSNFNSQVRWLQKEAPTSSQSALLKKIIQARNALFQSPNETTLVNFIPSTIDEWINQLPEKDLIQTFKQANEAGDYLMVKKIIKKLLAITNADLINQRDVALREAFKIAASRGYIGNIQAISSNFADKIPNYILGEALVEAAKNDYPDMMLEIMADEQLENISDEKIIEAFKLAASKGFVAVVKDIIASEKFKNIPAADLRLALGAALVEAAKNGYPETMLKIIADEQLENISDEKIIEAFKLAASKGFVSVVQDIIDSGKFANIPVADLGLAFRYAAKNGHLTIVKALIACHRFDDISGKDIESALWSAAELGHTLIVKALAATSCFRQISRNALQYALTTAIENGRCDTSFTILGFFDSPSDTEEELDDTEEDVKPELCEALLTATERGHSDLIINVISSSIVHDLTDEDLGEIFQIAAKKGLLSIVKAFFRHHRFPYISKENLDNALINATDEHQTLVVTALIACNRFDDISPDILGGALENASEKGYPEIVSAIIACRRFSAISAEHLGVALKTAALKGHIAIVNAFIHCNRFNEISAENLTNALIDASANGHADIVTALINCDRFNAISKEHLEKAFQEAAKKGNDAVVSAFINVNRFNEISIEVLGSSLIDASDNGHAAIVIALIAFGHFSDIPEQNLSRALRYAVQKGHTPVVNALISSSRFYDLSEEDLKGALALIAKKEPFNIAHVLTPLIHYQLRKAFKQSS